MQTQSRGRKFGEISMTWYFFPCCASNKIVVQVFTSYMSIVPKAVRLRSALHIHKVQILEVIP